MTEDRDNVFIGRAAELDSVEAWLGGAGRLLTLRGPGGAGKTTIAKLVADRHALPFVELESCRSEDDVWSAIAEAAACAVDRQAVRDTVRDRIVVLDNVEHVTAAVQNVLRALDAGRFLATSRERLGAADEQTLEVGAMDHAAARDLFNHRARMLTPSIELDPNELDALLAALDYLPLAVVLAATRTQFMTPTQILERLDSAHTLRNRRAPDGRHASLDACIAWSWELLDEPAKQTLTQCSVFHGSFTLSDAEAVVDSPGWVGDALEALVDESLLRVEREQPPRFTLYGEVRRFVARMFEPDAGLIGRYLSYLLAPQTTPVEPLGLLHAFDLGAQAHPNLSAELLIRARVRLWRAGYVRQTLPRLRRVTDELPLTPALQTQGYLALAACHGAERRDAEAIAALDEVEARLGGVDDELRLYMTTAACLLRASCFERAGQLEEARQQRRRGVAAIHERLNTTPTEVIHMLSSCGVNALRMGDVEEGTQHMQRAFELAMSTDQVALKARVTSWHATALLARGDLEQGQAQLTEALRLFDGQNDFVSQAQAEYLLCASTIRRDPARAIELSRHAETTANLAKLEVVAAGARVLRARAERPPDAAPRIRREINKIYAADRFGATLSLIEVLTLDEELDAAKAELQRARTNIAGRPIEQAMTDRYLTVVSVLLGEQNTGETPFDAAVSRALHSGRVAADDLSSFHDPCAQCLYDFVQEPLELLDAILDRRKRRKVVRILEDGNVIVAVSGDRVDMQQRNLLRRLLLMILGAHEQQPGSPVTVDELLEAGWPGEVMTHDSGVRRVYSAIRNLRKLGFEDTILTEEGGYVVDPDVVVVRDEG